ncbi:unnamed protein product [Staurois parvus]|uniref:Uncharacterized protein n=1 Tax=Staurois parvus TaxID=386267 RepID=A0ABN9DMG9_9NEOB|nr:unnamed protein product [Staurois parvus]
MHLASVLRVPFPAMSGCTGTELAGNLKMSKSVIHLKSLKSHSKTLLYQTISHTYCP